MKGPPGPMGKPIGADNDWAGSLGIKG
jgi:hypothetical protein